jgi:adenylate cyclase class 2
MEDVRREIEIKLRFDSADAARARLRTLGPRLLQERIFEDNVLFDRRHDPLTPEGKLLRLRRVGSRSLLTYKAPAGESDRHRVRQEEETHVSDHEGMRRILTALGFSPWYRYQKHRTVFEIDGLHLCLDETPLGCFLELEGSPEAIDRTAARLGFDADDYVRESYRELHEQAARKLGEEPGDLLVSDVEEDDRPR